jgi:hypothetical protein
MADTEEPRFTTLAERIAALNQQKNFQAPPPTAGKRPPPPPPRVRSLTERATSNGTNGSSAGQSPTIPPRPARAATERLPPPLPRRTTGQENREQAGGLTPGRSAPPPLPARSPQQETPPKLPTRRPSAPAGAWEALVEFLAEGSAPALRPDSFREEELERLRCVSVVCRVQLVTEPHQVSHPKRSIRDATSQEATPNAGAG